jgi:filamentous hemagglutinin family protein
MSMRRARGARRSLALAILTSALPAAALAAPQGGSVAGGAAVITTAPGATTITQQSQRAIINWQSFGIAAGETARFTQPNGGVTLNRVVGTPGNPASITRSDILGRLEANGSVWLVNPKGVLIGPGAEVAVRGFLAATADIRDADFMNATDGFAFATPSADAAAQVVNRGTITLADSGLAALVAPHVRNDGVIIGRLAQVVIAGAPTFTIDLQGDGLVQFVATSAVTAAAGDDRALVVNTGRIEADGGRVQLTAALANDVLDRVINVEGVIEARSIVERAGQVVIEGGDLGRVAVRGRIDVAGDAAVAAGALAISGEHVRIAPGADLGSAGGLTLRGKESLRIDAPVSRDDAVALRALNVVVAEPVTTTGALAIEAKHLHTLPDGVLAAESLDISSVAGASHREGGGDIDIRSAVGTLAIGKDTPDSTHFNQVTVRNTGDLSVGGVAAPGIDAGSLLLTTDGALMLRQPIVASGGGDALVLVADRFINDAGAAALQTPGGRWLVYSASPEADQRGELGGRFVFNGDFATAPPGSVAPGNAFIFRAAAPAPAAIPAPAPLPEPPVADVLPAIVQLPLATLAAAEATPPAGLGPPQLVTLAPPPPDVAADDLLFASDGNRELWELTDGAR